MVEDDGAVGERNIMRPQLPAQEPHVVGMCVLPVQVCDDYEVMSAPQVWRR